MKQTAAAGQISHLRYPKQWFLCASHQFTDRAVFPCTSSGTFRETTDVKPSTYWSNAK